MKKHKYERILDLYFSLLTGDTINKENLAIKYEVDSRTIQRDLDDLRAYLADVLAVGEHGVGMLDIIYDRYEKGYKKAC